MSDDRQQLCLSLALWNGADPILKERFFGLTNAEGNHGEDVKEYYFHVDNTPTHSYMRLLYKYPQAAYPYDDLVSTNRERSRHDFEYELLDTGVFAEDRYFDVDVEYAKAGPEDLVAVITVTNRGPVDAHLDVLASIWFRNTWTTGQVPDVPVLAADGPGRIVADHADLGRRVLSVDPGAECLFTNNETNAVRLFGGENSTPYVKDGINDYVVARPPRCGQPGPDRHQGGGPSPLGGARRRLPDGALAATPARRRAGGRRRTRPGPRCCRGPATGRGRRVLSGDHPAGSRPGQRHDHAARPGRDAVEQAVLLLRPRPVAAGSTRPTRCAPRNAMTSATSSGSTCKTGTSCRCRTAGSTRGTRPGTWPSIACR